MSSQTICLQYQAKKTLALLSQFQQNTEQWDWQRQGYRTARKEQHLRILKPIKNLRPLKTDRNTRNNTSQISHRGRTTLIPSKVSLENQDGTHKQSRQKTNATGNIFTKQNLRPYKTIRNAYALSKKACEREEEEGIDFMQYWIRHRFQENPVGTLVERLRSAGKNAKALRL